LLKSRVSDKYVNDSNKATEDKLTKMLQFTDEKQLERLEKTFKELGVRIITTNNFFNEKFEDLRKVVTTYDSRITGMATNEKLASVQTGYRDMKYNFEREMESLQDHLKETKDKIGELYKRFSNLEQATNSLAMGGDFTYGMNVAQVSGNGGQS
jgi:predicted RNase H-like nuclease (RuvC/YqgF family)